MMREESGQGAEEVQGGVGEEQDAAWDHGWDELAEAELAFDPDDPICGVVADDDDVIVASDGGEFQMARAASSPKAPSKEIQARHNHTFTLCSLVPVVRHGQASELSAFQIRRI